MKQKMPAKPILLPKRPKTKSEVRSTLVSSENCMQYYKPSINLIKIKNEYNNLDNLKKQASATRVNQGISTAEVNTLQTIENNS